MNRKNLFQKVRQRLCKHDWEVCKKPADSYLFAESSFIGVAKNAARLRNTSTENLKALGISKGLFQKRGYTMNREILFRGKLVANGEWAYGNLVVKSVGTAIITPDDTPIGKYGVVDTSTVGQFTGLKDKNGKKIFEGDIVDGCDFSAEDGYGIVQWADGAFEICGHDLVGTFHENYFEKDFEVIGNIYDNPELLEEEKHE